VGVLGYDALLLGH